MADSSMLSALTKEVKGPPLAAPGPMLGGNGYLDPRPSYVLDNKFQTDLNDVVEKTLEVSANDKRFAFAVVDLTDDPKVKSPAYAGWNDSKQLYVASMVKLLPLYAAFQLRADLRALSSQTGLTDLAILAQEARQRYKSVYEVKGNLPQIETFFTLNSSGKVDFTSEDLDDFYLDGAHNHRITLNRLKTRERLRLMAGWSDNIATGLVIRSLGFDYLWALARKSGLFRQSWGPLTLEGGEASGPAGLFIASDFDHHPWRRKDGRPKNALIFNKPMANARSVATLMTMLGQDRLIDDNAHLHPDHEAHYGMWEMLRKLKDFGGRMPNEYPPPVSDPKSKDEVSPIGQGMYASGWEADQVEWDFKMPYPNPRTPLAVSKVGMFGKAQCNTLLVRTERPRKSGPPVTITAVLVGIDNANVSIQMIKPFGQAMATKLEQRHATP